MADDLAPPARPAWLVALLVDVEEAFAGLGPIATGWPHPHPDRDPTDDEYSRVTNQGKYRIIDARVEAWAQVLVDRGWATSSECPAEPWLDLARSPADWSRVRKISPTTNAGLTILVASTLVDGEPFGADIGITGAGLPTAFLDTVPGCGCDACDSGSDDLLEILDDHFWVAAQGGVAHARNSNTVITRTPDGWRAQGEGAAETWLDESTQPPAGVQRWFGKPWRPPT